ncbi:hypothetical protein CQJ94_14435 [Glycomyces fuscus]|nr:hypothetical protein CQJ94_14435 [Glycomyces fuscus]
MWPGFWLGPLPPPQRQLRRPLRRSPTAVPNCVTTALDDSGWTDELTIYNNCSHSVRVKVLLAFRVDSHCITIGSDSSYSAPWGYPGRFDGLVSC